ncbi:prolyl oligopeptidase family serine peptidase [Bremerella sp. P1]|uniref:prolyl oligopeptidase family serine peptidase n=1 Tax=Bremerella sp. P1 TaxID=3026424 RepID=UPI00236861BA|nr:prolyl oligopeptidase family serine peptidase [Bremerella sp. P1]WDI42401.1 prolyl oligopeptidase family serine peptidase [Bremerella sp. P1]
MRAIPLLLVGLISLLLPHGGNLAMAQTAAETTSDDPNLWLEDVTGEKALDWVKEQNKESTAKLTESEGFQQLEDKILKILNSNERIPFVVKRGPYYYNFWQDGEHPRGLWRRTTPEEYVKENPEWDVIIDVDALGKEEGENWVWHGVSMLRPDYRHAMVKLSRGGADADIKREFDMETREFVEDGFYLPEAKSRVSWKDKDTLIVGTNFGEGSLTDSGYPRIVKEWKRGTELSEAKTIFEGEKTDVSVTGIYDKTPGFEREFVSRAITFWTSKLWEVVDGELVEIEKPDDAEVNVHREWIFVQPRSSWEVGGKSYEPGALLVGNYDDYMQGKREFTVLFEPTDRKSLAGYSPTKNHLIVNELDNVRNKIYLWTPGEDGKWKSEPLPGVPQFGSISVGAVDEEESDEFFLTITDYTLPTTLYLGTCGDAKLQKLKSLPAFYDATGMVVEQFEATSQDGTKIPYFQVSHQDLKLDGKNATLLYGYGGFEVPLTPNYSATTGTAWLTEGGVFVVANIRGGGEFGPKWHQAALKENRHKAYEDFIAVAEDLIARKVTTPEHLGVMGGSNGGLLTGNMLVLRPDLWGAVVSQVPLLDMKRFHLLLAGASWMGEYGNPDEPEEWEFIQTFSPYHLVKKDVTYPNTLFTTSTRDDRVHPGHARKMVARMKKMGHPVLYYENIEGGHAGAADNKQRAFMTALTYEFLKQQLMGK